MTAFPPKNGAKTIPRIAFIQSNSGSRGLMAPNGNLSIGSWIRFVWVRMMYVMTREW